MYNEIDSIGVTLTTKELLTPKAKVGRGRPKNKRTGFQLVYGKSKEKNDSQTRYMRSKQAHTHLVGTLTHYGSIHTTGDSLTLDITTNKTITDPPPDSNTNNTTTKLHDSITYAPPDSNNTTTKLHDSITYPPPDSNNTTTKLQPTTNLRSNNANMKTRTTREECRDHCSRITDSNKDLNIFHADNRIINWDSLQKGIGDTLCCSKCVIDYQKREKRMLLYEFGLYVDCQRDKEELKEEPKQESMTKLVEKFLSNKKSKRTNVPPPISIKERTCGITSSIRVECNKHQELFETTRMKTSIGTYNRETVESYMTNNLLVMAIQSFGGGGTEVERIISFLGLPHAPSFGKYSFHRIESKLGVITNKIAQEEINKALNEEVEIQLKYQGKEKKRETHPLVNVSYDMGWQMRSSGHSYNSLSGHGLMIGEHTKKVLGYMVKSKDCRICNRYDDPEDIPSHDCPRNHEGSSKSMEVDAILELIIDSWENRNFGIQHIVVDDDTTMIAHLRHSYADMVKSGAMSKEYWPVTKSGIKKSDKGRLPIHIHSPIHRADLSHRKKVVGTHVYQLASQPKYLSTVDKVDAEKIKTGWGYMLYSLRELDPIKDIKEIMKRGKAVLEHRFNNHTYCGDWCFWVKAKQEGRTYKRPDKPGYHTKRTDMERYKSLKSVLEKFTTKEVLCESTHTMSTQKNEALNTSIARLCPKAKHLSSTTTLRTRVEVVVCCTNMGPDKYYEEIFNRLTGDILNVGGRFDGIAKKRKGDRKRQSTRSFKRRRRFRKESKRREEIYDERTSEKRGTYQHGARFSQDPK